MVQIRKEQIRDGAISYEKLDDSMKDYLNNLEMLYMGVSFPNDGSQTLPRTGNPAWATSMPWVNDIALVLLADDLTENEVLATPDSPEIPSGADLTGASGQVMVRRKLLYYREFFDENGNMTEHRRSPFELPGFKPYPFFTDGIRVGKYCYLPAYEGGNVNEGGIDKLVSVSAVAPLTGVDLATFRTRAEAHNAGQSSDVMWHAYDFGAQHLIQSDFYLYYASLDSQGQLPGYTEASSYDATYKRNTGRTDGLTTMNGSVDAALGTGEDDEDLSSVLSEGDKIANRFLFIVNIFGHIWKMMDGVSFDGRVGENNTVWLSKNPADYSSTEADILADYEDLGLDLTGSSGYISTAHQGFIPKGVSGSSSSYLGDYFYSYLDDSGRDYLRLVRAGGHLSNGGDTGVACRSSDGALGHSISHSGSRLCAKKFS